MSIVVPNPTVTSVPGWTVKPPCAETRYAVNTNIIVIVIVLLLIIKRI